MGVQSKDVSRLPSEGRGKNRPSAASERCVCRALPGAAEHAEAFEDQPDRLLQPKVRIEAQPVLAMPKVADRHADPEFAAPSLGTRGIEHAGADHAEFELADAPLHAQQEAIVR